MLIREATIEDSEFIASYLLMAMEDIIFKFIGKPDYKAARDFLLYFVKRENNQYSYQNCLVVEDKNKVIAAVNLYDGAKLKELREPIIKYLKAQFAVDFNAEDETQAGEYYIDSLAIHPNYQGKGVGSQILKFLIKEYVNNQHLTLGLLVDEENIAAKKLYLKVGFESVGGKILVGKRMDHLQIKPGIEKHADS